MDSQRLDGRSVVDGMWFLVGARLGEGRRMVEERGGILM
jgi:hypothetical protein